MSVFEFLEIHKKTIFSHGGVSTICILYGPDSVQGLGATLNINDSAYNADDSLKCISNFVGVSISTETGLGLIGDSAQATLNMDDVTIGAPEEDWKIYIYIPSLKDFMKFKIEDVMPDRTLGLYSLNLSVIKNTGEGKKVYRQGLGGM